MATTKDHCTSNSYIRRLRTSFYMLDTNKDGVLSQEELAVAQSDAYKKEAIDAGEVLDSIASGWEIAAPDGKADFALYLKLHVQCLNDEEWKHKFQVMYTSISESQFHVIDLNKDGVITLDEYEKHVRCFGTKPANVSTIAKAEFDSIDTNKDGSISLDEYVTWRYKYFFTDDPADPIESWGWLISDGEWDNYCKSFKV